MAVTSAASLGISSCDKAPTLHPLKVDAPRDRFLVQELVREEGLVFRNVEWQYGLKNLNGATCFEAEEAAKMLAYLRRIQKASCK